MRSRRTQQQLLPHAFLLADPRAHTATHQHVDEQRSTGRPKVSQTAFWDATVPPTQQMCGAALSLLSLGVFLLGKHHPEFLSHPPLRVDVLPSQSQPAREFADAPLSCGRRNTQPEHAERCRESLQIVSFVERFSPQTSLNKPFISDLNHLNVKRNS